MRTDARRLARRYPVTVAVVVLALTYFVVMTVLRTIT